MSHWSADVDDHGRNPGAVRVPTAEPDRRPDRPPSRAERRAEIAHMVAVLSEALATQIDRLVASTDPAPEGWWFGPEPSVRPDLGHDAGEHPGA